MILATGQTWTDPRRGDFELVGHRFNRARGERVAVCYWPATGEYTCRSVRLIKQNCKPKE